MTVAGRSCERGSVTTARCWLSVLLLLLLPLFSQAAVRVAKVPPAAAIRNIDLQPGDLLETTPGKPFGIFDLLTLQLTASSVVPDALFRVRAGTRAKLILPIGRWDLRLEPTGDAALPGSAEWAYAQGWAHADAARFDEAEQTFAAAATAHPELAYWLWLGAAEAFEKNLDPDRTRGLRAAQAAVQNLDTQPKSSDMQRMEALRMFAQWQLLNRQNVEAAATLKLAMAFSCQCLRDAELLLLRAFLALREGRVDDAANDLRDASVPIDRLATQGTERALLLQRQATLQAMQRRGLDGANEADRIFADALQLTERVAPDSALLGRLAFNAHLHALESRRYADAERYARTAHAAFQSAAPHSLELGQARAALAEVYLRRTEYDAAEPLLVQARDHARSRAPDSYETLSLELQLADLKVRQRMFPAARAGMLALDQKLRDPNLLADTRLRSDLMLYRANLALAENDWSAALEHSLEASDAYGNEPGVNRWQSLLGAAQASLALNRHDDALRYAQLASSGLSETSGAGLLPAEAGIARARALVALGRGSEAVGVYEQSLGLIEAHRAELGGNEEVAARWAAQFQDCYHELFALLSAAGSVDLLLQWESRYRRQALQQLARQSNVDWSKLDTATLAPTDDSAQLSFLVGPKQTLVLVRVRQESWRVITLPQSRAQLGHDVDRLLLLLGSAQMDALALQEQSRKLFDQLLVPLWSELDGDPAHSPAATENWLIKNDGPLHHMPWSALFDGEAWLVERKHVRIWSPLARRSSQDMAEAVVGFGDPTSTADQADSLPGARRELSGLVALYPEQSQVWLGLDAHEQRVRSLAPKAAVLHFAVHAQSNLRRPMASLLRLAPGSSPAKTQDDGSLTAEEIANELKLRARLVVLSACASARGADLGGDGLQGLVSALHKAGADSVLATLWPVHDGATAELMMSFHRARADGQSPADALAAAQRQWLAEARVARNRSSLARWWDPGTLPAEALHPFYWAAFQVYE
ncbi:MAG: CHAT domain-containing protein [Ahniella sp.]|nr:CHAT domain-containing protein [Ahniella sp.]